MSIEKVLKVLSAGIQFKVKQIKTALTDMRSKDLTF
jgi:hypothetical protein